MLVGSEIEMETIAVLCNEASELRIKKVEEGVRLQPCAQKQRKQKSARVNRISKRS